MRGIWKINIVVGVLLLLTVVFSGYTAFVVHRTVEGTERFANELRNLGEATAEPSVPDPSAPESRPDNNSESDWRDWTNNPGQFCFLSPSHQPCASQP
jgi:hypothetical protein